ncbi:MAG: hypothetical protein AAGE52_16350 [Myxococcota bacterium]
MTAADQREEAAAEAGRTWAGKLRSTLAAEGRAAAGGWPGTMSEARARLPFPLGHGLGAEELARLTRVLYHAARDTWLSKATTAVEPD